ncbi:MAG: ABC transporter permease [Rhodospirillales bacterium]|nr:ABC transporter permease [Rhodospirillales bacterium]
MMTAIDHTTTDDGAGQSPGLWRYLRALARDPVTLLAVVFLIVLAISALGAELVAPHDPTRLSLAMRNKPPLSPGLLEGVTHYLGTDELGRDLLSRLIFGGRVSIAVGLIGALFAGVFGTTLGLIAGYYRGRTDDAVMRAVDAMAALPTLLIALFFLFVVGAGFWNLVIVLAFVRWRVFARLTRGMVLSLREQPYVLAAKAIGASDTRIIFRHVLPNILSPLMVLFTLEVAVLILAEAALSFLGFGIQPPDSSWGLMIARGREYLTSAWWLVTLPGLAIFLTTLGLNLVAAWARAITDPVQRWRWLA